MVSEILLETLREYYFSQKPCRLFVSWIRAVSMFTGVIEKFDNEFILLKDKYGEKVTIKCRDILRVEKPPSESEPAEDDFIAQQREREMEQREADRADSKASNEGDDGRDIQ